MDEDYWQVKKHKIILISMMIDFPTIIIQANYVCVLHKANRNTHQGQLK